MNNKTIITILLALFAMAGQGQNPTFRVQGNINKPDYMGMVHIIDLLTNDTVATAQVVNGVMQPVEGQFSDIRMCRIVASDGSFQRYTLYIDMGITVMDGCDEDGELRLSGTPICDELNRFNLTIMQNAEKLRDGKQSEAEADSIGDKLIFDFISRHADDILGIKILTDMAMVSLPPTLWLDLFDKINPKFSESPRLANYLSEAKAGMEAAARTWVGKKFMDFAVEYNDNTTYLSDYVGRGQYVLADFWASWCGPCRQQMPDLIALHQQYCDKGLMVLAIAIRDKAENTEQAIRDLNIPYPQIVNAQDFPGTLYGIDAIPHTILFAPDGIIVARNIHGSQLKAKLAEIFGETKKNITICKI